MATVERVAIATQFVSAMDGIDCCICFRPSDFKDCVAIAMCLIVVPFFPFLLKYVGCFIVYYTLSVKLHNWRSRTTKNVFLRRTEF